MNLFSRHRFEEVLERFRLEAVLDGDAMCLPYVALNHIRVERRPLTAEVARQLAESHDLTCDEQGIRLSLDGDATAQEDALVDFLGQLLEGDPRPFFEMPRRGALLPATLDLPRSTAWLERFYGDSFLPREKKPMVIDLARCPGPYLRSCDDEPLQILDSASQIASLPAGVRPGVVQAAIDDGRMAPHLVAAQPVSRDEGVGQQLAEQVLRHAAPGLKYVAFTNGGSEANEKALFLARRYGTGGTRIAAFKGSFHGRTLLSLFSTWNPVKREPYQLAGYETDFVPFPVCRADDDPPVPHDWSAHWENRDSGTYPAPEQDTLLRSEVEVLDALRRMFLDGNMLACLVEPYQCEGGDRPATRRFFHGLRALTRGFGVPLIFDEVQCGFGLAGDFFWHRLFWLTDADGAATGPDLVTCAKRAQTGLVLSRWPDPHPTPAHSASVLRGAIHAEMVTTQTDHATLVASLLAQLEAQFPALVSHGRVYADAFGFDLPTREIANGIIGQRFYRGCMVYIAGERTLRYRLNRAMSEDDVRSLFGMIERSIEALHEWAGSDDADALSAVAVPRWAPDAPQGQSYTPLPTLDELIEHPTPGRADQLLMEHGQLCLADRVAGAQALSLPESARGLDVLDSVAAADAAAFEATVGVPLVRWLADALGTRIDCVEKGQLQHWYAAIDALEAATYEPARRDPLSYLSVVGETDGATVLVATDPNGLVGMSFAGPLELWWGTAGPDQDPNLGKGNTLYSADITVAAAARGRGLGKRLRERQILCALYERHADGSPRYAYITGRNRVGEADAMWTVNQRYGAYEVARYDRQYGEAGAQARYYRIPLRRWDRRAFSHASPTGRVPAGQGLQLPTGTEHPLLVRARDLGVFDEPACTKLTVSNFITRGYARYAEFLAEVRPRGTAHMYFTSSLDEMVDKSIRVLKHKRKESQLVVGMEGGYFGHTTAGARSVSDSSDGFFPWPSVPHPTADPSRTVAALDRLVAQHGAEHLIGVYVETVQAHTGEVLSDEAFAALAEFRDRTGVPLVLSETTTGMYRSGRGRWWLDGAAHDADVVLFWCGGQIGHIFCSDDTFVQKPLAFISTWDGDELSGTRNRWAFEAAAMSPVADRIDRLEDGLSRIALDSHGLGLYRVIRFGGGRDGARRATEVFEALQNREIDLEYAGPNALRLAPPVTISANDLDRILQALGDIA